MIDAKTKLVALIGNPVEHSLSPAMHNAAFQELGLNYAYLAFKVKNPKPAIEAMKELGFKGYSVTIPHKETVIPHLDSIDALAKQIGAVNTIVNDNGLLAGYNTDAAAALSALKQKTSLSGKKVSLVGAGGAARAIAFALKQEKAQTIVFDIVPEKARALAHAANCKHAAIAELKETKPDILINATPIGMFPNIDAMPVGESVLKKGMIVFDIVYNPFETLLLKKAKAAGCETISGIEMFVGQGAAQFELWTGVQAPKEIMRSIVATQLKK